MCFRNRNKVLILSADENWLENDIPTKIIKFYVIIFKINKCVKVKIVFMKIQN